MQYQKSSNELNFRFESKNFLSIFGLYLFSLGAILSGYSLYLLLESVGRTERIIISWTGQGLFWFLILFLISIFILFIPVDFLNVFRVYNSSFKDLIINIIYSIFISLFFLILFQYSINLETLILILLIIQGNKHPEGEISKYVNLAGETRYGNGRCCTDTLRYFAR